MDDAEVQAKVERVAQQLGSEGRILLRASGTEPVLRVMVEAQTDELCRESVDSIIAVMEQRKLLQEV